MEWEKQALDYFDENVLAGPQQIDMRRLYAEKLTRAKKKAVVTQTEVEQTIKDYADFFGEDMIKRVTECFSSGEGMPELPPTEKEGKPCLYQIETCHSKYFGCPSQIIDVREISQPLIDALEDYHLTELLADKSHGPLMLHNKFTISISSCANVCTGGESKDMGIWGVEKPRINPEVKCVDCKKCMEACWDSAISFKKEGQPIINERLCKLCGACIRKCPTGTIELEKRGYRILVGGMFGRMYTIGKEVFRMGERQDIFKTLDAVVSLIREKQDGEHFLSQVVDKVGIDYINRRVFGKTKERKGL